MNDAPLERLPAELDGDAFEDAVFESVQLGTVRVEGKGFRGCTFRGCQFLETCWARCRFEHCRFERCVFAGVRLDRCSWLAAVFARCKLAVNWAPSQTLHPLDVRFEHCVLDYSSFLGLDLKGVVFERCSARQVNFAEADLGGVALAHTDLQGAEFLQTNLRGADLRTARHYAINPLDNAVAGAQFAFPEAVALLEGLGIVLSFAAEDGEPA